MKVIFRGETDPLALINGKVYEVLSIEEDWYRIIDETGEDYLYPPEVFDLLEAKHGSISGDGIQKVTSANPDEE